MSFRQDIVSCVLKQQQIFASAPCKGRLVVDSEFLCGAWILCLCWCWLRWRLANWGARCRSLPCRAGRDLADAFCHSWQGACLCSGVFWVHHLLVFVLAAAASIVFYHCRNLDQEKEPCSQRQSVVAEHVPGLRLQLFEYCLCSVSAGAPYSVGAALCPGKYTASWLGHSHGMCPCAYGYLTSGLELLHVLPGQSRRPFLRRVENCTQLGDWATDRGLKLVTLAVFRGWHCFYFFSVPSLSPCNLLRSFARSV